MCAFCLVLVAGQLGHPNEMVANATATNYNTTVCYISEARLVTALSETTGSNAPTQIACSDGCTIFLDRSSSSNKQQQQHDVIYVCNDYKIRRLYYTKETASPFVKVLVHGGKLDRSAAAYDAHSDLKWIEDLDAPILIVGLTQSGRLYIWREREPTTWRLISWPSRKPIPISIYLHLHMARSHNKEAQKTLFKSL